MKFKTKQEKRAFFIGWARAKKKYNVDKSECSKGEKRIDDKGKRNQRRKNKHCNSDLDFSKYFDFDERGHIKGSYTCDGFFEPD